MAQEDAGMIVTDQDVMKKIRVKKSSTELSLTTPLASLLKREKQPNEIEGRGGPYRDTTPKRQRDKEWQMNENDLADLTIKQTLELDFLFWQTAMERSRKK